MYFFYKRINLFTKYLAITSVFLLCYGYFCRYSNVYFFWESKSLGWIFLFVSVLIILFNLIQVKKEKKKKAIIEKIGVGLIIVVLTFKLILFIAILNSDAYEVSKKYLKEDIKLKNEIGTLKGTSLMLQGGIQKSVDSNGESGNATISLTLKGDLRYKDITVYLSKLPDSYEWKIDSVEYF